MVMKGQYLERPTIVPIGENFLEGLFHRGQRSPAALIVAPLAPGGSPMEVPIVAELAWAMHRSKRPTLRFNPRGFGASTGVRGDEATRLADVAAALQSLRQSVGEEDAAVPVAVIGVQSGAEVALRLAGEEGQVNALVLLAPPPELWVRWPDGPLPPTLVVLSEGAAWPKDRASRGTLRIEEVAGTDPQFLRGLPLLGRAITRYLDGLSM